MSSTRPDKLFALVDCDNFYVSCERVFQPKLRNQPVVVLSNNDGCIVARSREVKAFGIGMGKPFHEFKDLIYKHRVKVFSSNYTLYGDMSRRVMETLRELVSRMDIYSIDEAFVTIERNDGLSIGRLIRQTVLERTGIPVTVGIGPTKTLAKIAVEYAKNSDENHRVCDLTTCPNPDSILASILVQDVWGIGLRIGEWLYERKVNTALDLKNMSDEIIRKRGGITALRVVWELRGISCVELTPLLAVRKSIISSRSFGKYVTELDELKESVATHATIASEKLRHDGSVAGLLSAFITTNVFSKNPQYANTACVSVNPASNAACELVRLAITAVERIYKPGFKYIKAGVILNNISPASERQTDMFAQPDMAGEERLYRAVDYINADFGSGTVKPLACGINQHWAMKRNFNSPRYTTKWDELPVARIG